VQLAITSVCSMGV